MSRASLAQRRGPNAIADQLPDKSLTALFYSRPWIVLFSALLLCLDAHACAPELATGVFGLVWMAPWPELACQAINLSPRRPKSNAWGHCLALELPGWQHPNSPLMGPNQGLLRAIYCNKSGQGECG